MGFHGDKVPFTEELEITKPRQDYYGLGVLGCFSCPIQWKEGSGDAKLSCIYLSFIDLTILWEKSKCLSCARASTY